MNKYIGQSCPICGDAFDENSDVVVCPECGAPHHRDCYAKEGHCFYESKHGTEEGYKASQSSEQTNEQNNQNSDIKVCVKCGASNSSESVFCEKCGALLQSTEDASANGDNNDSAKIPNEFAAFSFIDPYGGVAPDSEIDGVSVQEIALFVGQNSRYYIPKFKALSENKNAISWNWSAFIFNFFYFVGRKIKAFAIIAGLILLSIVLITNITTITQFGEVYIEMAAHPEAFQSSQAIYDFLNSYTVTMSDLYFYLYNGARILFVIIAVLYGLFANRIYKNHVIKSIKKLKMEFTDESVYKAELFRRGGFSSKNVKIAIIASVLGAFAVVMLLSFIAVLLYMV